MKMTAFDTKYRHFHEEGRSWGSVRRAEEFSIYKSVMQSVLHVLYDQINQVRAKGKKGLWLLNQ